MSAKHGPAWDVPMVDEFTKQTTVYKQTWFEKTLERLDDGLQWLLNRTINPILYKRKRKVKVKLHPYDTWEMSHTLSLIILPLIKQLRATKHGTPWVPDEDVPAELGIRSTDCVKKNDYDWDENCHKRWDWVLNEIEWVFTQLSDPDSDDVFFKKKGEGLFDYEIDKEAMDRHEERMKRGLMLFGKNFRNFWD